MLEVHGGTDAATKAPAEDDAPSVERKVGALARARRAVLSDDRLARHAAAGDIDAFEAICSRYRDDLYRFCVGILREPQDAQDAVQNTMIKAMRALPGERRQMQLKPWLYRIAHNEAVELRRRERPVEELPVTVDDASALTDERAEENGRLRTLLADIADLPERQRASLVLREVNGLGFGEIGAALGTSPGAVRQALYEARRALGEMDNGRDMRCDVAARMVSDADGRSRDRGVRAHLRECSPCRRFQTEIKERGRTLAAISPMPAIAAAGARKAALGGAGVAGSGAVTAAGGAGAGAGAAGVAVGSIGASALLKPAAGLLTALAIGTAAVDHGAILGAGRHDPATAEPARLGPAIERHVGKGLPGETHPVVWHAPTRDVAVSNGERVDSMEAHSPIPAGPPATAGPAAEDLGVAGAVPQPRTGVDARSGDEVAPPIGPESHVLDGATHAEAVVPTVVTQGAEKGTESTPDQVKVEGVPPGQVEEATAEQTAEPTAESPSSEATPTSTVEKVPPGQAKKEAVPPGQAKKDTVAPGQSKAESLPPGQAKKEAVPPGQAKKEVESAPAPEPSEGSTAPVEATEAPSVAPEPATTEEATTE
jgi:RNA polymerase sigma factor (sigma-70 family)